MKQWKEEAILVLYLWEKYYQDELRKTDLDTFSNLLVRRMISRLKMAGKMIMGKIENQNPSFNCLHQESQTHRVQTRLDWQEEPQRVDSRI